MVDVGSVDQVTEVAGSIVVDFERTSTDVQLDLNGVVYRAHDPLDLAAALELHRNRAVDRLVAIPYEVVVEGSRVIIHQDPAVTQSLSGAYLTGAEANAAVDKAERIATSSSDAWPAASSFEAADLKTVEGLVQRGRWGGPLVVAMPRTGSTLMGILFLLCRDPDSATGHQFDRYLHEPAAPVYWRGDNVESIAEFTSTPLTARDVVQESAYQFAHPELARWFLTRARPPVVFTMRHPQLAWPSRWRAMLGKMLVEDPRGGDAEAARAALTADDFSSLGDYLTRHVRPADNGWYAFLSLLEMCNQEGIDYVLVDNTRFREDPEATLRELCVRLGVGFDTAMTEWTNLDEARSRIVMSDLALGEEYEWYYAGTLGSDRGILPETHNPIDPTRFPAELRGVSDQFLTIDEAVTWYQLLLTRPETMP
jgi:hypothetical protein